MNTQDKATLGGGCFWCLEAVYEEMRGILSVRSGYMGGKVKNPTYREVCSGTTGHVEVVEVTFDLAQISYAEVLNVFFAIHDPTTRDRQGNDVGSQYRSAIFYHSAEQKSVAEEAIRKLDADIVFDSPIVTVVEPAGIFYEAEDYHQHYFRNNPNQPYCAYVVSPKVAKFRQSFSAMRR